MSGYLRRLVTASGTYQVAEVVSKLIALLLLPVYTRYLTRADYGTAELILTLIILTSIVVRLGLGEAFVRFHFLDADSAHRTKVARAALGTVFTVTTAAAVVVALLADPLSQLVLGSSDPAILRIGALGLWAFTNLELAYALLRVEERYKTYLIASLSNVMLTVMLTLWLVVVRDSGAFGLLAGNYLASTAVLVVLWIRLGVRLGLPLRTARSQLGAMLRFGLPTVPAEMSVFALNVIDRLYLYRVESSAAAGLYSLAVKLSAAVVIAVRGFQYAWPPLAYSVTDDRSAARLYARVTTYYVLICGYVVVALALLGRWVLKLFAAPSFFAAHTALPWVALGWALYGLFLVMVVIAGRAGVTTRNAPAALVGLVVNVALLLLLVEPLGIEGAGIALCGAYLAMVATLHLLVRRLFEVEFERRRLTVAVAALVGVALGGELLLPAAGAVGFALRLTLLAVLPPLLWLGGYFDAQERIQIRSVLTAGLGKLRRRGG